MRRRPQRLVAADDFSVQCGARRSSAAPPRARAREHRDDERQWRSTCRRSRGRSSGIAGRHERGLAPARVGCRAGAGAARRERGRRARGRGGQPQRAICRRDRPHHHAPSHVAASVAPASARRTPPPVRPRWRRAVGGECAGSGESAGKLRLFERRGRAAARATSTPTRRATAAAPPRAQLRAPAAARAHVGAAATALSGCRSAG